MMTTKYLSEIITNKEIEAWKPGDNVFLYSGTGTGKTTFITKKLEKYANEHRKRILMLEPRTALLEQQKRDIRKAHAKFIDVELYQNLDNPNINLNFIKKYDFVVLDECHFLFSDSGINDLTNEVYERIAALQCVKIWVSATPDNVFEYFLRKKVSYKKYPEDYIESKSISQIYTFTTEEELENVIASLADYGVKAMIIINDTKKLLHFYRKYSDIATIVVGKGNVQYKNKKLRTLIKHEIEYMSEYGTFSKRLLFGTSALDCGLSVKDSAFQAIVIDGVYEMGEIKQITGRKRKQYKGDKVTLYIRNVSNSKLNGYNSVMKRWVKPAFMLMENGVDQYLTWYQRNGNRYPDRNRILYDKKVNGQLQKCVNEMKLLHYVNMITDTTNMIKLGKNGFKVALKNTFDVEVESWTNDAKQYIEKILEEHFNKGSVWWTKAETQEFAKTLGFTDKYRHIITSYKAINSILENEFKSEYRIACQRKRKKIDGKSKQFNSAWVIIKVS